MKLIFRLHAIRRMFERAITVDDVAKVFMDGKVIEDRPGEYPYQSSLWLGYAGNRPLHVAVADNEDAHERVVITGYEPDPTQWTSDSITRT